LWSERLTAIFSFEGNRHISQSTQQSDQEPVLPFLYRCSIHYPLTQNIAYAVKALKELHESRAIAGKASGINPSPPISKTCSLIPSGHRPGKQIIYHTIQDPTESLSIEDLQATDGEISKLQTTNADAKVHEKSLRTKLTSVNATISTDELRGKVQELEREKENVLSRLRPLRKGDVKPVLPEEKEAVDRQWKLWRRKAAARKKIAKEVWAMATEELPEGKTKEGIWVSGVDVAVVKAFADCGV